MKKLMALFIATLLALSCAAMDADSPVYLALDGVVYEACPTDGGFIPDLGAMLALIEKSAGRKPDIIIGKPYREIAEYLIERTGVPREKIAMIGDRLYTDIETGIRSGMLSVLVMSGETTREMLASSATRPDYTFDRLCDMNPLL